MLEIISDHVGMIIRVSLILVVGLPLVWFISKVITKSIASHVSPHIKMLIHNAIWYAGISFLGITLLNELGFRLSALIGAAGVFGVAVGFAAQTSFSNIISGIFLLAEQPFKVGDTVVTDKAIGKIESIDLLSVKIRTLDNTLVRIPNETLLKNPFINRSYFSYYRLTFEVGLPVDKDAQELFPWIENIVQKQDRFLDKPAAIVEFMRLDEWTTTIRVRGFVKHKDITSAAREFIRAMYAAAYERGILISVARTDIK